MASQPGNQASKLFIDSSVLIAAAISPRGTARDLLAAAFRGEYTLAISSLVLEETERNLTRKAPAAVPVFQFLKAVLSPLTTTPPIEMVQRVATVVEVKDAPIVAAALHAGVDYLVTYDRRHLLSQAEVIMARHGLIVTTPDAVLQSESRQPGADQAPEP
jgi:predicted nucleic acid-binding protein